MTKRYILTNKKNKFYLKKTSLLDERKISVLSNPLRLKILREISKKPKYPAQIAEKLELHEQKIYYHIKKLLEKGIIEINKKKEVRGGIAKYYKPTRSAFTLDLGGKEREITKLTEKSYNDFLEPFISNGNLNSYLIVGSPDPHGKYKSRGTDGFCAIDLGILLGSFTKIHSFPVYKLDTELKEKEKGKNLIIIGGPKTNKIMDEVNDELPIRFERNSWDIVSDLSQKKYSEQGHGIIVKKENPFNSKNKILIIAGKRFTGTKASILALVNNLEELSKGNKYNKKVNAKVVWGYDKKGDGSIDSVEILE